MTEPVVVAPVVDPTPAADPAASVTLDPSLSVPATGDPAPTVEPAAVADGTPDVKPTAPAEYAAFNLPQGMEIGKNLLEESSALARELDLSQEQAQKFIDLQVKDHTRAQEAQDTEWTALNEQWVEAAAADSELGGTDAQFEANTAIALKAIEVFGNDKLRKALTETGAGNHPEMIRFMYRVGKAITEDTVDKAGKRSTDLPSVAKRLFPSMENE